MISSGEARMGWNASSSVCANECCQMHQARRIWGKSEAAKVDLKGRLKMYRIPWDSRLREHCTMRTLNPLARAHLTRCMQSKR